MHTQNAGNSLCVVKKIIHDDVVHVDSVEIANVFNDCFVDIGRNIAESIRGNVNHLDDQPSLVKKINDH